MFRGAEIGTLQLERDDFAHSIQPLSHEKSQGGG